MTTHHLPVHAIKGRGVSHQQPHRFERDARAAFDDGWGTADEAARQGEEAAAPATQVSFEQARSAITRNQSPDLGFTLGLNPYRGCEHVMWREKSLFPGVVREFGNRVPFPDFSKRLFEQKGGVEQPLAAVEPRNTDIRKPHS